MTVLSNPNRRKTRAGRSLALAKTIALAIGLTLAASAARASTPRVVYVLAPGDLEQAAAYEELRQTLGAHLTGLEVGVRLLTVDGVIDGALATQIVAETSGLAVAWITPDDFHLLTPALGAEPRTRSLAGAGGEWIERCQAIAAITHAELEPVFEVPPAPSPLEEGVVEVAPVVAEPVVEDGIPADPEPATTDDATVTHPATQRSWAVLASVGYTLARPGVTAAPLHGVGLGLGARFGRHVGVRLGLDLSQTLPIVDAGEQARIARWPLRLSVSGEAAVRRLDVVGRAGLVVDLSRVRELGFEPADPAVVGVRADLGLTLAAELRLRVLPWLAPFIAGGLDVHTAALAYELGGEDVARRGAVVPRLMAGVAWIAGREGSP